MRVATWNLRGIKSEEKLQDLADDFHQYGVDALGVQETHLRGTGSIDLPIPTNGKPDNQYTIYYTGPEDSSHHGVGIIIKKECNAIFKRVNNRICYITVNNLSACNNSDRKVHILSAYAPTLTNSVKTPKEAEIFYNTLERTVNSIPSRDTLFICSDTNAQIGTGYTHYSGSVGKFGKGFLNSNGERLGEFLIRNGLILTNTLFEHKHKHRVTWIHPNNNPNCKDSKTGQPRRNPYRNQIDYVITRSNIRTEITNSRSYHGTKLNTDHKIVICDCDIKLYKVYKSKQETKTDIRLNVSKFKHPDIKASYQSKVNEKLEHSTNTVHWNEIVDTVLSTGEEVLGKQQSSNKKSCNQTVVELSKKQLELRLIKESCQDPEKRSKIQKERNKILKQIKKHIKLEKEQDLLNKIENVEKCKNDSRRMFAAVRELNRKVDKSILVEGPDGFVHSPEQKVTVITAYFENIFKQEHVNELPAIKPLKLNQIITTQEVIHATKKLKNNKSPGCDNVQSELIKYGPNIVHRHIADILNRVAETGEYPEELKLGQLIPLPKPNKPKGPAKNLRPIILLSVLRKILAIIVVGRTFDRIRNSISTSQAAYSPGRSTTELVFAFKILTEKAICAEDYTIYLLMLDMSRAFDTIDRGTLLQDLSEIINPDELHLVSLLLIDVKLQVKYNNTTGKIFIPDIGSPQGDCASPIWFIFYLHKALTGVQFDNPRDVTLDTNHDHPYNKRDYSELVSIDIRYEHDYSKCNKVKLTIPKGQNSFLLDQQYADDASWATTVKRTKDSIKDKVPTGLKVKNLFVNCDKTEDNAVSRNGDIIWKNCKFLGSLLGNEEDIKRRKQLACAAFRENKAVLCSSKVSLNIRKRVFVALVESIFLYNSELWSLSCAENRKIDTFQRSFLRQIIRNRRISNNELYKAFNVEPWSTAVKRRRLTWFGHLNRLPDDAPAKRALAEARRPYKRVRGGQRTTWLGTVAKDFKAVNTTVSEAIIIAQDRIEYARLVHSAMAPGHQASGGARAAHEE